MSLSWGEAAAEVSHRHPEAAALCGRAVAACTGELPEMLSPETLPLPSLSSFLPSPQTPKLQMHHQCWVFIKCQAFYGLLI